MVGLGAVVAAVVMSYDNDNSWYSMHGHVILKFTYIPFSLFPQ